MSQSHIDVRWITTGRGVIFIDSSAPHSFSFYIQVKTSAAAWLCDISIYCWIFQVQKYRYNIIWEYFHMPNPTLRPPPYCIMAFLATAMIVYVFLAIWKQNPPTVKKQNLPNRQTSHPEKQNKVDIEQRLSLHLCGQHRLGHEVQDQRLKPVRRVVPLALVDRLPWFVRLEQTTTTTPP